MPARRSYAASRAARRPRLLKRQTDGHASKVSSLAGFPPPISVTTPLALLPEKSRRRSLVALRSRRGAASMPLPPARELRVAVCTAHQLRPRRREAMVLPRRARRRGISGRRPNPARPDGREDTRPVAAHVLARGSASGLEVADIASPAAETSVTESDLRASVRPAGWVGHVVEF